MFIQVGKNNYEDRTEVYEALELMVRENSRFQALIDVMNEISNSKTLNMYKNANIKKLINEAKECQTDVDFSGAVDLTNALIAVKESKDYLSWEKEYNGLTEKLKKIGLTDSDPFDLKGRDPYDIIFELHEDELLKLNESNSVDKCIQNIKQYEIDMSLFPFIGNRLINGESLIEGQDLDELKIKFIDDNISPKSLEIIFTKLKENRITEERTKKVVADYQSSHRAILKVKRLLDTSSHLLDVDAISLISKDIENENKKIQELMEKHEVLLDLISTNKDKIEVQLELIDSLMYQMVEDAEKESSTLNDFKITLAEILTGNFYSWLKENNYIATNGENY